MAVGNMKVAGFTQGLYEQSSTAKEMLGTRRMTADGRIFEYQQAGAVALDKGIPTIRPDSVANHINKNVAAAALGETLVSITIGATACAENAYAGGYLQVNDGTGQYDQYPIISNTYSAGSGAVDVVLAEGLRTALVASGTSEASLIPSPYTGIIVSATTKCFAGVPPIAVTALYYFWNQIGGICNALNTNAVAIGSELAVGTGIFVLATAYTTQVVGVAFAAAGVTDEGKPVLLYAK